MYPPKPYAAKAGKTQETQWTETGRASRRGGVPYFSRCARNGRGVPPRAPMVLGPPKKATANRTPEPTRQARGSARG